MSHKLTDHPTVSFERNEAGQYVLKGFGDFSDWALNHIPIWKSACRESMYASQIESLKYLCCLMTQAYCDQSEQMRELAESRAPVVVVSSCGEREKRVQEVALQLVARTSANVAYAFKLAEEYVCECERRENEVKKGGK